jgi:hypothetical protein
MAQLKEQVTCNSVYLKESATLVDCTWNMSQQGDVNAKKA